MPSKPTLFGCASPNAVGVSAKYSDASGGGRGHERRVHLRERGERRPRLRRRQKPLLLPPLRRGEVLEKEREFRFDQVVVARAQIRVEASRHAHARVVQRREDGRTREEPGLDRGGPDVPRELQRRGLRFRARVIEVAEDDLLIKRRRRHPPRRGVAAFPVKL